VRRNIIGMRNGDVKGSRDGQLLIRDRRSSTSLSHVVGVRAVSCGFHVASQRRELLQIFHVDLGNSTATSRSAAVRAATS